MRFSILSLLSFFALTAFQELIAQQDTLKTNLLEEITVNAFESKRPILETTASVGVISPRILGRYPANTFTNAVNTIPGVRMEERSPGSYRFSVRGSLLRSPFGVRNVKFYWNGIPYTDANGNTPLNSLDFGSIDRLEVIKGPGSSVYGAGTGGVVLMSTTNSEGQSRIEQSMGVGKYGFRSRNTELTLGNVSIRYGHQQQDGYRQQSGMVRDVIQVNSSTNIGKKGILTLLGLYSDLHYQTPGGINLDQYKKDPTLARQPTPTIPGSITQNAGIYTRYSYWGVQHKLQLSQRWDQSISAYLSTNDFANPFITNYEKRDEQGLGGRNIWSYSNYFGSTNLQWSSGFEWQYGKSTQRNYGNDKGKPTGFLTSEDIRSLSLSAFTQAELRFLETFTLNAGISYNSYQYGYERFFPSPYTKEKRKFDPVLSPRIALNKTFLQNWSVTASLSSGYSPPTIQEVRPSAGGFQTDLAPESGINKEISIRRVGQRLVFLINAYQFKLKETIVRRTNETGAEYFINAGKTNQKGLEWRVDYDIVKKRGFIENLKIWNAGTLVSYTYQTYQQGSTDFSGKKLPGVPSFTQNTGLDFSFLGGLSAFVTYQYGEKVFLNDANTVEAPAYQQLITKISWKKQWTNHLYTELSTSSEWVKAEIYSLGYDLNAFGNRYFNGAAKQNQWAGIKAGWKW